jgi:hypothetical protein
MNRKKTKKGDAFTSVMLSLKEILEKKPPLAQMKKEVDLMGFSIRPVVGDAEIIKNIDSRRFIETLWTIGKIDLLLEKKFHRLTEGQKQIVIDTLTQLQEKMILKAKIKTDAASQSNQEAPPHLMLEIFRKQLIKKDIN